MRPLYRSTIVFVLVTTGPPDPPDLTADPADRKAGASSRVPGVYLRARIQPDRHLKSPCSTGR